MKFEMIQEDIDNATVTRVNCPISRAIRRTLGVAYTDQPHERYSNDYYRYLNDYYGVVTSYVNGILVTKLKKNFPLSKKCHAFMKKFDNADAIERSTIKPISFTLRGGK
ncbi:MAG TPA: hypothetical protein VKR58_06380 [Aquella sp.]|nr:hypothetical protein [Aquella sp.]